jgi:hypothetical protein
MDRVESPQRMLLGQHACQFHQCIRNIDNKVAFPIVIKILQDRPIVRGTDAAFAAFPRKSGPRLCIRDARGRDDIRRINQSLDCGAFRLRNVEFDERAGIEIENQRRSSRMIRETRLPFTATRRDAPLGLVPFQDPIPLWINSLATCASG